MLSGGPVAYMNKNSVTELYQKYYSGDRARHDLFRAVAEKYTPQHVLYPGSFIHINASLVFPKVTYIDNDKQAKRFFANQEDVIKLINKHKTYPQKPVIDFKGCRYEDDLAGLDQQVDMLISLFAGFISKPCRRYLTKGGILVVNDSHGDASLAAISKAFKLVGVLVGQSNHYTVSEKDLDQYFRPKKAIEITEAYLRKINRGLNYKRSAPVYLFEKL